jgi:hypothetical protein
MDFWNWGVATWAQVLGALVIVVGVIVTLWPPKSTRGKAIYLALFASMGVCSIGLTRAQERRSEIAEQEAKSDRQRFEQMLAEVKRQSERPIEAIVRLPEPPKISLPASETGNKRRLPLVETGDAAGQKDERERRKANRALVAKWLTRGDAIKIDCTSLQEKPELEARAYAWHNETFAELRSLDPGYAAMFQNPSGPSYTRRVDDKPLPRTNNNVWNWVNLRTEVLSRILERMPQ